jgi:hypothetical protein
VKSYERGRTRIPDHDLFWLAGACDVEPDEILAAKTRRFGRRRRARTEVLAPSSPATFAAVSPPSPSPVDVWLAGSLAARDDEDLDAPASVPAEPEWTGPRLPARESTWAERPAPVEGSAAGNHPSQLPVEPTAPPNVLRFVPLRDPETGDAPATNGGGRGAPEESAGIEPVAPAREAAPGERAGVHWEVGGVFPATAIADDGTLALRRADTRWALADVRAPGDAGLGVSVDLHAGGQFGILFRASVDDRGRVGAYSFDVDAEAAAMFSVRLWDRGRPSGAPIAQAPIADAAALAGKHKLRLVLRGDTLAASVDGSPVVEVVGISRLAIDAGGEPCHGDRVGIHASSMTEVTVESFWVFDPPSLAALSSASHPTGETPAPGQRRAR